MKKILTDTKDPNNVFWLFVRRAGRFLAATFFPPKCMVCGTFEGLYFYDADVSETPFPALKPYLCSTCRSEMVPIESPLCSTCGVPFISRAGDDHRCSQCLTEKRHFIKARSFGVFGGSLMEAIHRFKYGKKLGLSFPLALLVRDAFFRFWDPEAIDLLIPVPLHMKRLRKRGFNQAYLLITRWAKREGFSCHGFVLRRERWTEPQTSMDREARRKNMKGAFSVTHADQVTGKRVLLVDDVYTTGSTVDECARVLMKAGAKRVDVLTLARAVS